MSIQGVLNITLSAQGNCTIRSTRPIQAGRLFSGKSVEQTLKTIPLLFSICAKAQTITAARAIESAMNTPASRETESQREALITLESLREQSLRLLMDWPAHINEAPEPQALSHVVQGIQHLMQALQPEYLLSCLPESSQSAQHSVLCSPKHSTHLWNNFSQKLSLILFGSSTDTWLETIHHSVDDWAAQQQTQMARLIYWLNQQDWKQSGTSHIALAPDIKDSELVSRLLAEKEAFTRQPDWQGNCYEVSWFQRQQGHVVVIKLNTSQGNGIYTRMVARLIDVAELMQKLDRFFTQGALLQAVSTNVRGLAHTDAARGRLTHYIELENQHIKQLIILAPTEWNFHSKGVAQQSLENLITGQHNFCRHSSLKQQADLVIHAIDPCVGYQLTIESELKAKREVIQEALH
jgi:hypothetical protein